MSEDKELCCCGHIRAFHPYGGRCSLCGYGCNNFHKTGDGHSKLAQVVLHGIILLAVIGFVAMIYLIWTFAN